jgi:hypothetical protein
VDTMPADLERDSAAGISRRTEQHQCSETTPSFHRSLRVDATLAQSRSTGCDLSHRDRTSEGRGRIVTPVTEHAAGLN